MNAPEQLSETEKKMKIFRRLTALPFVLTFVAFLMPLVTFSCSDDLKQERSKPFAEFTAYELALGISFSEVAEPGSEFQKRLDKIQKENPIVAGQLTFLEEPARVLYGIFAGVLIAAVFALFTPLGSLILGACSFVSMWLFIDQLNGVLRDLGLAAFVSLEPGHGAYAAGIMMIFGFAMNLASILRPILEKRLLKKKEVKQKA